MIAGIGSPSRGSKPFIAATDVIGCLNFAKDFVVAGTASSKLFGVAEGLWEPDLVSHVRDDLNYVLTALFVGAGGSL